MRRMTFPATLCTLCCLFGCNVKPSNRVIELQDEILTVRPTVGSNGIHPIAISADGTRMFSWTTGEHESYKLEIRDMNHVEAIVQANAKNASYLPILFTKDNKSLVMVTSRAGEIVSIVEEIKSEMKLPDLAEGEEPAMGMPNHDYSMMAFDRGYGVTNAGSVIHGAGAIGKPYFDQFGSAWYKTAKVEWIGIASSGQITRTEKRPGYLVEDPRHHCGSMHLEMTEQMMSFEGTEAKVTAVWLKHDRAVLRKEKGGKVIGSAALIFAGVEVIGFAFVPGRHAVAVVTNDGTTIVPYTIDPKKN